MIEEHEFISMVARYFNLTVEDLRSSSRKRILVTSRHITMYILRKVYEFDEYYVCKLVNRRARSTVYNAVKQITNLKSYDLDIRRDLSVLIDYISNPYSFTPKNVKIVNKKEAKLIHVYDKDMERVYTFSDVRTASEVTGVSISTIHRSLSTYKRLGRGYYWIKK